MHVAALCSLPVGIVRWHSPQPSLTVVVKGTFSLARDGRAEFAEAQDPLACDRAAPGGAPDELAYASDFAPQKLQADVLLAGHAHAAAPSSSIPIEIAVDDWRRRLWAVDDRPATCIPLLERHLRVGDSPRAAAARVMAGPHPRPTWLQQATLPGFTYAMFNVAPPSQRLELLRSGATLRLAGLLPGGVVREVALPGIRPKVFLVRMLGRGAGPPDPREITMRCDTLWIDGDRSTCTLAWRGTMADPVVADPQACLVVALQAPGTPRSWGAIYEELPDARWKQAVESLDLHAARYTYAIDDPTTAELAAAVRASYPPSTPAPGAAEWPAPTAPGPSPPAPSARWASEPPSTQALAQATTARPRQVAWTEAAAASERPAVQPAGAPAPAARTVAAARRTREMSLPVAAAGPHPALASARLGAGASAGGDAPVEALEEPTAGDGSPRVEESEASTIRTRPATQHEIPGTGVLSAEALGLAAASPALPFAPAAAAAAIAGAARAASAAPSPAAGETRVLDAAALAAAVKRAPSPFASPPLDEAPATRALDREALFAQAPPLPFREGLGPAPLPSPAAEAPHPEAGATRVLGREALMSAASAAPVDGSADPWPRTGPRPDPALVGAAVGPRGASPPWVEAERAASSAPCPAPPGERELDVTRARLPLATYAAVRVELWQGRSPAEVLPRHGLDEARWAEAQDELAAELARMAARGDTALPRAVQKALLEARAAAEVEPSGLEDSLEKYVELRARLDESDDPSGLLHARGVSGEQWERVRKLWTRRALGDAALSRRMREELARAREGGRQRA